MQQKVNQYIDLRTADTDYPLSRRKLQSLIAEGRLHAYRLDGKIILRRQDIERLLTANPVTSKLEEIANEAVAAVKEGR